MSLKLLKNRPLFKECIDILETNILPIQESDKISELFIKMIPITKWGKVDWDKIDKKIYVDHDPDYIISALKKLLQGPVDKEIYIEWSSAGIPVIKANLDAVIKFFDYVTCVAFEKFIFNPSVGYIIEVRTGDEITVGLVNPYHQLIDVIDAQFIENTKTFLQEFERESTQKIIPRLSTIENMINTILSKIQICDKAYEAKTYFDLLNQYKNLLKNLIYKERIEASESLRKFVKDFNRIDQQWLQESIFEKLKKGEYLL